MLPEFEEIEEEEFIETSNTCKVDFGENIVIGNVDGIEAVKQAVYVILHTERYLYLIHSWDFGIELDDLIGEDMDYVEVEVERRITEALEQDDRIESVENFEFERNGRKLTVTFEVYCVFGSFVYDEEMEF